MDKSCLQFSEKTLQLLKLSSKNHEKEFNLKQDLARYCRRIVQKKRRRGDSVGYEFRMLESGFTKPT